MQYLRPSPGAPSSAAGPICAERDANPPYGVRRPLKIRSPLMVTQSAPTIRSGAKGLRRPADGERDGGVNRRPGECRLDRGRVLRERVQWRGGPAIVA